MIILFLMFFMNFDTIYEFEKENLVQNCNFEDLEKCPSKHYNFEMVKYWSPLLDGSSPDIFSNCSEDKKEKSKRNFAGKGKENKSNYVGLILYSRNIIYGFKFKEYIGNILKEKLSKNNEYGISFSIKLAECSQYLPDSIGIALISKEDYEKQMQIIQEKDREEDLTYDFENFIVKKSVNFKLPLNFENRKWTSVKVKYDKRKVLGNEQILVIGNFKPNENCKFKKINMKL